MRPTLKSLIYGLILILATCLTTTAYSQEVTKTVSGKNVAFVKLADNFIILYDSSSSMGATVKSGELMRLDIERQILTEKNATLPQLDWQAGLYTFTPGFGKQAFNAYIPMQTYSKELFTSTIKDLPARPSGTTLLQHGLVSLDAVLAKQAGKTIVFLFTDGQYTVNNGLPSPGVLARQLAKKYDICFYVIDTDDATNGDKAVQAVASATECGKVIRFSELLGHPEWLTNPLFMVKGMKAAAKPQVAGRTMNAFHFDFDKAEIKPENYVALNELAIFLQDNPGAHVTLAGYTDSKGSDEYNLGLSQRRAASVRAYLVEKGGIDNKRITLSWFGKAKPIASNQSEAGRAKNRRVESIITGMK
ncbi:OmpA family protein [Desulfogranum mediterraneum]|uniref:OmpA family protein n=1 Tax=Desulfogranum mediterraneum TaxID=160661 RepID=UPI0003FCB11E|nr:OmpA family protein [Desulfogranum mediterraneum]